jgi:Immunoglobulin-like domain of bacterial spore germination
MNPVIGRSLMVVGLVLLALVVASPGQQPPPSFAQEGSCPPNPSPPDPSNPRIIVETPEPGQRVTSPAFVSGSAAVFEGTVRISILDAAGNTIADTFADGGAFELEPFSASVSFAVSAEQAGCIRVFEPSARDGGPPIIIAVQVPVTLASEPTPTPRPEVTATPTKTPVPKQTPAVTAVVKPPSTGDGGLVSYLY